MQNSNVKADKILVFVINHQTNVLVPNIQSSDKHISVEKLLENLILTIFIAKFTLQLSDVL